MHINELSSSLRFVASALHKRLRKQAASTDIYSMTEMETIGHLIRATSLMPTELAALTRVKTQSMSQILKKMEQHGIIERTPSESDKRKVYISLSAEGLEMIRKMGNERNEWMKRAIETELTEAEIATLAAALPLLMKLADSE
jgi:DNA-binding MarR family transcriptional regulator